MSGKFSSYLGENIIDEKVTILKDFCVPVTVDVRRRLESCKTHAELDAYCHKLIFSALES